MIILKMKRERQVFFSANLLKGKSCISNRLGNAKYNPAWPISQLANIFSKLAFIAKFIKVLIIRPKRETDNAFTKKILNYSTLET